MAPSLVWEFYKKLEGGELSECNFCRSKVGSKAGTTSGMRNHLTRHPDEYNKLVNMEKERERDKIVKGCEKKTQ